MRRLITTIIGIALLPAIWGSGAALYELVVGLQTEARTQKDLVLFLAGGGGWVLVFLFLGRPVRLYILGHELTHLLAAWASGIRGGQLEMSRIGGSVTVERLTFWVSIAPYLVPLYTLMVLVGVGAVRIWNPSISTSGWLPVVLGVSWSFHLTFTVYALSQPQHDLKPYGFPGSLCIILLVNLLLLTLAAAVVHPTPLKEDLQAFAASQQSAYRWVIDQVFSHKLQ